MFFIRDANLQNISHFPHYNHNKIQSTTKPIGLRVIMHSFTPSNPMGFPIYLALLAKRRFYDWAFQVAPPDFDTDFRPGFCEFRFHISHTDTLLQDRRHSSGRYHTDDIAFGIGNLIAVTRNTFVNQLEGTQLAGNAFFLLAFQFGTIGEILPSANLVIQPGQLRSAMSYRRGR